MENHKNGREQITGKLSEVKVCLRLLGEILDGMGDAEQNRKLLLEYCRTEGLRESSMWEKLALYRQQGPAGLLAGEEQYCLFEYKQQRLRQRILELIGKLPGATLGDFIALLSFRRQFLKRLEYVSELLLYFFLEREKGLWRESEDSTVYTTYLNHKLFREFSLINEIITDSGGIEALQDGYENWLLDQALDEEVAL
ncbi:MAG: hypothetical protein DRH17_13460 [Deltaproteobacteria bacterium]|nr:MAG: hypothetical protein DRH17_13460 [Deltaproteobacteria bacterium]